MPSRSKLIYTVLIIVTWVLTTLSPIGVTPAYAASFSVGDAAALIAAINTANGNGVADTITLTADITLTAVDNALHRGNTGLPAITSDVTIEGNGHTLSRDVAAPQFRILVVYGGNLTVQNLTVSNGVSSDAGGGIYNRNSPSTLTVRNSSFSGNSAAGGGGIYSSGALLTVSSSSFSGNSAGSGGGIGVETTATISNSAFSGNSASSGGGGIYNALGTMTVKNSTLSGNFANIGGGIRNSNNGTLHLFNTIIANSPSGGDCVNTNVIATNLNNLIEDGSCSPALSGDPSLGALVGSPAYFPLNPDSLAIDAGDATACAGVGNVDQRGVARPIDGNGDGVAVCDIGSYEAPISPLKRITAFTFPTSTATTIDEALHTIAVAVPYGTNPNGLIATFTKSAGASVAVGAIPQVSGTTPNNFTSPVTYRVTAADASTQDYIVTVTVACSSAITVTNANDSGAGSLRQAMLDICAGGTITFDANYTITLASQLPAVTTQMTITGAGAANTIVQADAAPYVATYRVFEVGATGDLTLNSLTVRNGHCNGFCATTDYGGGVYNRGALTVINSAISGNSAVLGGGVCNYGTLTITNSAISGNYAAVDGGGVSNDSGSLTVTNSAFSGNYAALDGDGVYNWDGTLTITNSTFSGNSTAGGAGGGVYSTQGAGSSSVSIINSTIAGNTNGGGVVNVSGTMTLKNTIIASNTGGNCSGTITNGGNNIDDGTSCGWGSASGSMSSTNPLLGALGNYGGTTQTIPLLPGSPAIDAGDSATCADAATVNNLDQRGVTRPAACDIGAFESRGFTLTKTGGDNQSTLIQAAFPNPLVVSVTSAFGEPVNGGQVIFTAPLSGASLTTTPITLTIANGAISSTVTANGTAGSYSVIAGTRGAANVAFNLTNDPAGTTTSVTSTPNPSIVGQAVALTATVTSAGGTPSGSVQFYADGAALGSPVALSNGQVGLSTSALAVGTHPITATYGGDANYLSSTSNTVDQVVNPADTTIAIASALNPSIVGQAVKFTATVTSIVGTPSGSVQFYVDGAALGSPLALSNGQASLSTSTLAVGTHPITATYSGDANHNGGTSNQVDQVVNHAKVYLPLISHNFVNAPDLIVQSLTANANTVQVVIKNQGTAPVVDEFWVDVYVNPTTAPTGVNQTWQMLGDQGLVWGVTADALPALTPGGVLTLTMNDAHFFADLSAVTWPLAAGTRLYAQVDSANAATTYGAVLETHEVLGLPYNNIFGPVLSSALTLTMTPRRAQLSSATLPLRPH